MKSFKEKTNLFWSKFCEKEKEIREQIDNINTIDTKIFVDSIGKIVSLAFNDQPFELGINTTTGKYEMIFSPNGNEMLLLQLMYLVEAMPSQLEKKWTIYSSSPSCSTENQNLELYIKNQSIKIEAQDFVITTHLNNNSKKININVSVPLINELPENEQYRIIFLMLDRCISEIYTMKYIGEVNIVEETKKSWLQKVIKKDDQKRTIPLPKLKSFIDYLITDNDWSKPNYPYESWSVYKMNPSQEETSLRKDILIGTTNSMSLMSDVLDGETNIYPINQLAEDGISLMYIFFSLESTEKHMDTRNKIEEKIASKILEKKIASLIGTAMGNAHAYLDYMVFDMEAFTEIVALTLQEYDFKVKGMEYIQK